MASTFLSEAPLPGDGAWLLQGGGRTRQRKAKSFLQKDAHGQVRPVSGASFLGIHAEDITAATPRTSYHPQPARAPENSQLHAISSERTLSHGAVPVVQPSRTRAIIQQPNHAPEHSDPYQAFGEDSGDLTFINAAPRAHIPITPPHLRHSNLQQSATHHISEDNLNKTPADKSAVMTPAKRTQVGPVHTPIATNCAPLVQHPAAPGQTEETTTPAPKKKKRRDMPDHRRNKNDGKAHVDGATDIRHDSPTSMLVKGDKSIVKGKAHNITVDNVAIAQRLTERHGAKVSQPKPAKAEIVNNQNHGGDARPVEPQLPWLTESNSGKYKANRGGQGRGRGRGRGGRGRAPRDSRWPHPSEARPDPKRWDTSWDNKDPVCDNSGWDQAGWNDAGWGDEWGNPNIQKCDGYQLMDWSGGWAPAPIDWDSRPAFHDDESAEKIDKWLTKVDDEMCNIDTAIPMGDLLLTGEMSSSWSDPKERNAARGEPAPRYWIPKTINNIVAHTFWADFSKSQTPPPFDEDDLKDAKPWWLLYDGKDSMFLKSYQQPDIPGINPQEENEDERLARENDFGSSEHAENRKRKERAIKDAERERRKKMEQKLAKLSTAELQHRQKTTIRPGFKVVVRAAKVDDIVRICQIYNFYVDTSVTAPETERLTDQDMQALFLTVQENQFPFFVACEKAQKVRGSKRFHQGEDIILPEKVVGFAYANDYHHKTGMYKAAAEVKVFVDRLYTNKSVAKCLFDKLLGLLDPEYIEKGGYAVTRVAGDMDGNTPIRQISNMIINLPYDADDDSRIKWTARWLEEGLGFEQVGHLKRIGCKDRKIVNLAILLRRVGQSSATPNDAWN